MSTLILDDIGITVCKRCEAAPAIDLERNCVNCEAAELDHWVERAREEALHE